MAMKQPSDLSKHEFVLVHFYRNRNNKVLEISIRIQPKPKPSSDFDNKDMSLDKLRKAGLLRSGDEALSGQEPHRASISQMKITCGDTVWRVLSSDAAKAGWGPFLYDIAMEMATEANAGLCSHESDVSADALKVWEFYFSKRSDVVRTKVNSQLKPSHSEECLQYSYKKTPPVIIEELITLDKWIEGNTDLDCE
tara:strand:+ start:121 stop:705 length:585 start_codon:yes stop_codon:yes gene_type:complete